MSSLTSTSALHNGVFAGDALNALASSLKALFHVERNPRAEAMRELQATARAFESTSPELSAELRYLAAHG